VKKNQMVLINLKIRDRLVVVEVFRGVRRVS
jgi:hypothetical protein